MGINLGSYVGATQVRRVVLGDEDRAPTPPQLDSMRALVREAMRDGAVGLWTTLAVSGRLRSPGSPSWWRSTSRRRKYVGSMPRTGGREGDGMLGPRPASSSVRAFPPRSSRASPPSSPARAARRRRSPTALVKADQAVLGPFRHHTRLAHVPRVLRPAREAGDGDQPRRATSARRRCAASSSATMTARRTRRSSTA